MLLAQLHYFAAAIDTNQVTVPTKDGSAGTNITVYLAGATALIVAITAFIKAIKDFFVRRNVSSPSIPAVNNAALPIIQSQGQSWLQDRYDDLDQEYKDKVAENAELLKELNSKKAEIVRLKAGGVRKDQKISQLEAELAASNNP